METTKSKETDISLFRHTYGGVVQFSEVDSYGVVHNLKYPYWLEWARTDYLKTIGVNINPKTFLTEHPLMTVHSEIDYFYPLKFNDKYKVLSRINWIKDSSLSFENVIVNDAGLLVAKGSSIMVNVNPATAEPVTISEQLRNLVREFEKDNVRFLE